MQEGVFTKIGAVATVIGVLGTWFSSAPVQDGKSGTDLHKKNIPVNIDIFDKSPLYTVSSGATLKFRQDIYLPAYKDVVYIQKGKFILNKENVNEYEYVVILKFKKSDKPRKIPSGKNLEITDSGRHGPEDREYRHTYIYLEVGRNDIDYLKCLGKDNSEYLTIGQFRSMTKGIFDVDIPDPKEI